MKSLKYTITHIDDLIYHLEQGEELTKDMFDEKNIFISELFFKNLKINFMVSFEDNKEVIIDYIFYYFNKDDMKYYQFNRLVQKLKKIRVKNLNFHSVTMMEYVFDLKDKILYDLDDILLYKNKLDVFDIQETINYLDKNKNGIYDNEINYYNECADNSIYFPIIETRYIYFYENKIITILQGLNKYVIIECLSNKTEDYNIYYGEEIFDVSNLNFKKNDFFKELELMFLDNLDNINSIGKNDFFALKDEKIFIQYGG